MAKEKLTDALLRNISKPDKPFELFDTVVTGLTMRVSKGGMKTFTFKYFFSGRARRFPIGRYPSITLKAARKQANLLHLKVKSGIDPVREQQRQRDRLENMTFRECAELFKSEYLPRLKESTRKDYTSRIDKHLVPAFGRSVVNDIQRSQIKRFLKPIAEKQPVHANRLQAILSKIFSYAVNEEFTTNHPLKRLPKLGEETRRDRWYSKKEVRELWLAFEQQAEPMQSLLKVLLLTGQRLGETSRMKWADIDTDRAIWVIPEGETKAGRGHVVPIIGTFKDILENLHQLTGHREHVFTSPMNSEKPLSSFKPVTNRIREYEKAPSDLRLHDLRRTAATYMAELGTDRTTLGKLLNHKGLSGDSHVTSIYDRHDYLQEKRRALAIWDSYLKRIVFEEASEVPIFKIG